MRAPDTNAGPSYFYPASRAHHAYVMALDFGMRFKKRNGFWTPEGLLGITGAGGYRIEVAEESLGLLEPQAHDHVFDRSTGFSGWISHFTGADPTTACAALVVPERKNGKDYFFSNPSNLDIHKRNGCCFHIPEFEP